MDQTKQFLNSRLCTATLKLGRRALACALAYLMIPLGIGNVYAQNMPPPPPDQQAPDQSAQPPQNYNALTPDQLDQLVAPIALYPDSLVAQILAASTYPSEIADADHFVQSNQGAPPDQLGNMANGMNWDPSVKALVAFPSVLANLDKNLDWTSQLGNAYYNQPQDVMSAVQTMRQRAYEAGNLRTTQQLAVTYAPDNIVIAPVSPAVVYVPYYNPWVVYGAPVVAWGGYYPPPRPAGLYFAAGLAIGFGIGIAVASWNHWGWGWHSWGMGWGSRSVVYQRNVYISRSVTVVNHGYYGHFDRNPAARNYNRSMAMRAPNYRSGYGGAAHYNNSSNRYNNYSRSTTNNYNRNNNSYNHTNNNYRPNTNYNHSNNSYNRPNTNYNRPSASNYNHSSNARPSGNYNRQQSKPQSKPQSHSAPRPSNHSHPSGGKPQKH